MAFESLFEDLRRFIIFMGPRKQHNNYVKLLTQICFPISELASESGHLNRLVTMIIN